MTEYNDPDLASIFQRLEHGDVVPIEEVASVTERYGYGPMPATRSEALAELVTLTGLDIETLERVIGRRLR